MDKDEWRKASFKRGDNWRSDVVYRCVVCHTKINKWYMGGWPGMGPRITCPGIEYKEHEELESALKRHNSLDKQIKEFKSILKESTRVNQNNAKKMIDDLCTKRTLLSIKIDKLRQKFSGRLDDIKGLDSKAKIEGFYPFTKYIYNNKTLDKKKSKKKK